SIPISEESNNSLSDNFSPEFETFCDHTEETRSGDIRFLKALLIDDESSNFEDDPSILRPPPEPPDDEFDLKPDSGEVTSVVMNNIDEPNEDKSFDPGGEIVFLQKMKMLIIFPSCLSYKFFFHISYILRCFLYSSPLRVKTPSLTLASSFRASGILLGWNFHVFSCLSKFYRKPN
nr:hypothetical protein [Tanacetum cinerariifolium]